MTSTVKIASTMPMALRIAEPEPNPEKPGLTGPLRTAVLNGGNAPGPLGLGVTEIDRDLWSAFSKSEAFSSYSEFLREIRDDEDPSISQYGFEPALEAATQDGDNAKAAKEGSAVTGSGPVAAADMATGSPTGSASGIPVSSAPSASVASASPVAADRGKGGK